MNRREKKNLEGLTNSYLAELRKTLIQKKFLEPDSGSSNELSKDDTKSEEASELTKGRLLLGRLRDLNGVASVVYNAVRENEPAVNRLDQWLLYFNRIGITSFPMRNTWVKMLLESHNTLQEADIDPKWNAAFEEEGIDLPSIIDLLLVYLVKYKTRSISGSWGYSYEEKKDEAEQAVSLVRFRNRDFSKVIFFDVKYRSSIVDLKSISLRAIADYKSIVTDHEHTIKYYVALIFTNEQEHNLDRMRTQLKRYLVEAHGDINQVFFLLVSVYITDTFQTRLEEVFRVVRGNELLLDYDNSPFQNGWFLPDHSAKSVSISRQLDSLFGAVLHLVLPSYSSHFFEHEITQAWVGSKIVFVVKREPSSILAIRLTTRAKNETIWMCLANENEEANFAKDNLIIPQRTTAQFEGWSYIFVDVANLLETNTSEKLKKIEAVGLRGSVTIAKIAFV